jgi:hypothetical protein
MEHAPTPMTRVLMFCVLVLVLVLLECAAFPRRASWIATCYYPTPHP